MITEFQTPLHCMVIIQTRLTQQLRYALIYRIEVM